MVVFVYSSFSLVNSATMLMNQTNPQGIELSCKAIFFFFFYHNEKTWLRVT